MQNRSLSGKTALVTGSTSGIGLGIAHALAAQGVNLVFNGFGDAAAISQLQKDVADRYGVRTSYSAADMSKSSDIEHMMHEAAQQFGGVDILVNNAGMQFRTPLEDYPLEKWRELMINPALSGCFLDSSRSTQYRWECRARLATTASRN